MKTLALETMGRQGSIAVLAGGSVLQVGSRLAETQLDTKKRAAQTITPTISDLLKSVGWRPSDLELIAVVTGPGSFTGLRIGVTTAKVMAYAVGADVIGVDAMQVIAEQAPVDVQRLHVVVGAERQQLFARSFEREAAGGLSAIDTLQIVEIDDWLRERKADDFVTGPGLAKIVDRIPAGVLAAENDRWAASAATVGQVGYRQYQAGHRDDLWKLLPEYGRRSAAEEKADAR